MNPKPVNPAGGGGAAGAGAPRGAGGGPVVRRRAAPAGARSGARRRGPGVRRPQVRAPAQPPCIPWYPPGGPGPPGPDCMHADTARRARESCGGCAQFELAYTKSMSHHRLVASVWTDLQSTGCGAVSGAMGHPVARITSPCAAAVAPRQTAATVAMSACWAVPCRGRRRRQRCIGCCWGRPSAAGARGPLRPPRITGLCGAATAGTRACGVARPPAPAWLLPRRWAAPSACRQVSKRLKSANAPGRPGMLRWLLPAAPSA
jgi:hypothetical protein